MQIIQIERYTIWQRFSPPYLLRWSNPRSENEDDKNRPAAGRNLLG
jgi:hypothetical protein